MTDTYTPKPGSLPDRVLTFLEANPDEELTRKDIAVKFDLVATNSIDTLLQLAVSRGCLVRRRNSQAELVWSLGTGVAVREQAAATGTDDPLPVRQVVSAFPARVPVVLDPDAIKVRKGVRLLTPAEKLAERFDALFAKFEVGDSAEFDADWEQGLRDHARRYSRGKTVRFVFAQTEPGKVGMERRA